MDKITTNPRGLGSKCFKISHTHLLLSPYNPADQEHNSNLLDTYERERIARDLEYYIHEAAKSTTNVKFNGLTGNDRQSGLRRAMSMPRERYIGGGGGGGMKNKSTEKKSKETIKVSRPPPERDTSGGGMKKSETERKGGGHRRAMSMPRVRDTSVDGGGDGMKNKIEKKSKEITQASMPPERNTGGGGGGGMKNKSEKKTKEITKASMPLERDTGGGGGGGMKKKSEKKNKEITKASGPPERDTSGGGMMKKSETRRKAIIQGNFWIKHASTVCSTMECDVVGFGRDFLRARMAAGRPPGHCI